MTKIMYLLAKIEKTVCVTFMFLAFFIILFHIIGRYIFNYPLFFAEETSRFLFIYLVMVGMIAALRSNSHTRVEYFINFLPFNIRKYLEIIIDCLCMFFLSFVIYTGYLLVSLTFHARSPALAVPIGVIYAAAPLAALLMLITYIMWIIDKVRS